MASEETIAAVLEAAAAKRDHATLGHVAEMLVGCDAAGRGGAPAARLQVLVICAEACIQVRTWTSAADGD